MAEEMISVIVPVYMGERWLPRCIDSIRNQSFSNLEIILVNDGSPDNSGKICEEYASVDDRIKVVHKENGGLSDARNTGIASSSGQYIMFVDEDDYIHPDMAHILFRTMQETNADIVLCDFMPVPDEAKIDYPAIMQVEEPICFEGREVMNQLHYRNLQTVVAWNKLYKRAVFDEHGYIKGRVHDDESAIHYILHACKRTAYIKEKLYYYVQREGSITSKRNWLYYSDTWLALEERLAFLKENEYEEMASFTKGHMLHYAVTNYRNIKGSTQAKAIAREMRKVFKELFTHDDVRQRLSSKVMRKYRCFATHPVCCSIYVWIEKICTFVFGLIRGVGHKIKCLMKRK